MRFLYLLSCALLAGCLAPSDEPPAAQTAVTRVHNFDLYLVDEMAVMTYQGPVQSASLPLLEASAIYAFTVATGCDLIKETVVSDARVIFGDWECSNKNKPSLTRTARRGGAVARSGISLPSDHPDFLSQSDEQDFTAIILEESLK